MAPIPVKVPTLTTRHESIAQQKARSGSVLSSSFFLSLMLRLLSETIVLSFRVKEASTEARSMRRCALKNGV